MYFQTPPRNKDNVNDLKNSQYILKAALTI